MSNDLDFVQRVVGLLESEGIDTWLAGGWAQELHGLVPPRAHHDVDLLYPGDHFGLVDAFMRAYDVEEIAAKRFAHKRAFELAGIMVEVVLVQRHSGGGYVTWYWGDTRYDWPADVFDDVGNDDRLRLASVAAIGDHRAQYDRFAWTPDRKPS